MCCITRPRKGAADRFTISSQSAPGLLRLGPEKRTQLISLAYVSTYLTSGTNSGLLSNVTLRRKVGAGSWGTVRQADYAYYDGGDPSGTAGDLKTAIIKDGAGATLDTKYYRYYTSGQSDGYEGALKYVFDAASFGRLAAAFADPYAATDAQIGPEKVPAPKRCRGPFHNFFTIRSGPLAARPAPW